MSIVIYICMCEYVHSSTNTVCISLSYFINIYMYMCACVHIFIYVYVHVCMYVYICITLNILIPLPLSSISHSTYISFNLSYFYFLLYDSTRYSTTLSYISILTLYILFLYDPTLDCLIRRKPFCDEGTATFATCCQNHTVIDCAIMQTCQQGLCPGGL